MRLCRSITPFHQLPMRDSTKHRSHIRLTFDQTIYLIWYPEPKSLWRSHMRIPYNHIWIRIVSRRMHLRLRGCKGGSSCLFKNIKYDPSTFVHVNNQMPKPFIANFLVMYFDDVHVHGINCRLSHSTWVKHAVHHLTTVHWEYANEYYSTLT